MKFSPTRLLRVRLAGARDREVGRLALHERRILFEFAPAFLAAPLPLSPVRLLAAPGVHVADPGFEGLFGLFDDSLPDGWGRLLLDREMARRGVDRTRLTPLDRLAWVGDRGFGALCYEPPWDDDEPPSVVDLRRLHGDAARVLAGDEHSVLHALTRAGGSSGGARPKVSLWWREEDRTLHTGAPTGDAREVIVKFPSRNDPPDSGPLEWAYHRMAQAASIEVAPSFLLGGGPRRPGFFATHRFDRAPRIHAHSAAGLLHADPRVPCMDYADLLATTRWLTRDERAVEQVFLRAAFNVLAHNRDDHSRNFAFVMDAAGTWRPSPAYDLTFSGGPAGEHWMTVAGEGASAGREHLIALARKAGLRARAAREAIERVRAAVSGWDRHAREAGVSKRSRERVASALAAMASGG